MPQVTKPWLSSRFSFLFVCFRTCYPSTHLISIFAVSFYFPYRSDDASEEKKNAKATLLLIRWNYNTRSTQRRKRRKGRIFTGIDIALEHSCFQGNFCFFFSFFSYAIISERGIAKGTNNLEEKLHLRDTSSWLHSTLSICMGFLPYTKVRSSLLFFASRSASSTRFSLIFLFFNSFQFHFFFVIYQTFLLILNASHVSFIFILKNRWVSTSRGERQVSRAAPQ